MDEVTSRLRVVPIARKAIERTRSHKSVADVACTAQVMYVFEGAIAQCTATVNHEATGWTLTFHDAAGTYTLASIPGHPWQLKNP